jgi:hypothetical protein
MSRGFGFIKDLKKDVDVCKIGIRVLDLWTVTASNGRQHLELIIGDAKVRKITSYLLNRYFSVVSFCCLILLIWL